MFSPSHPPTRPTTHTCFSPSSPGEDVTDDIALRCIEARMDESMRQRRRVVGIAIKHCRIHTLDESLGCVFPVGNTTSASSSSTHAHTNDVIDKANASMGFLLEANLRHILVNSGIIHAKYYILQVLYT